MLIRLSILAVMLQPAAIGQFSGVSSNTDGSLLHFASTLRLKNAAQPLNGKLFTASKDGILLYRAQPRTTVDPLASTKYTGYGITLRAAVDTPNEVSIHLQQIDEGPNYRWGIAGEGGCGVVYYYAGGRSFSHNGREDVGDRPAHDTDFASNFGVWKNGSFRSVGRNVLERPLADLGFAQ